MKIQSIQNNNQSFEALTLTSAAKRLLSKEKGAIQKISQYTEELVDSKYPVKIGYIKYFNGEEHITADLGNMRGGQLIPAHLKDEYIMVYSAEIGGDVEDDVVETLKFSNSERAKEVYVKLKDYFHNSSSKKRTELDYLEKVVYSSKILTEADIIPNEQGPWEWLHKSAISTTKKSETTPKVNSDHLEKVSFITKLKRAWGILTNK